MTNLIRLRVPPGADDAEISHGTESYRPFLDDPSDPDSETHVLVPRHAALHFVHNAGFETVSEIQAPAPAGMALLAHPEGPTWPDGSPRTFGLGGTAIAPRADGLYEVPVHLVPDAGAHGLGSPERVAAGLKTKLEEKLGVVDAAEVAGDVTAAVMKAVAKAEAERDAAVRRAEVAEDDLAATKKELDELRGSADANAAKAKSQAKEIKALNVEVEKSEREITELLNTEQVEEKTPSKKK